MAAPDTATPAPLRHPWQSALSLAIVVGGIVLLWQVIAVLLVGFAGVLGAVLLCTCAHFLQRWTKCGRRVGVTVVLIVLVAGASWFVWKVTPLLVEQFTELRQQLEANVHLVERWINRHSESLPVDNAAELEDHLTGDAAWARIGGIFSTAFGAVSALAVVSFVAIFLAYDPDAYLGGVLRLVPPPKRARAAEVMGAIGRTLSRWLVAQLISMSFLAVTTWVALTVLGVPLALVLALLCGIMTFVPYLGPLLAAIPVVLVALVGGPSLALYTAITYLVIQTVESNVLMPLVYQRTVQLAPALTLTTQVLLGALLGLPGFMLATPLAAAALVAVRMLYVQDFLDDDLRDPVPELRLFDTPRAPP